VGLFKKLDKIGSLRNDAPAIEVGVGGEVVHFDLFHVYGVLDVGHLVDLSKIIQNGGGRGGTPGICFEIHDINLVETQKGHEKTNVSQSELVPCNISLTRQDFLHTVKRFRQLIDCSVVCVLRRCEPTPVDSVVDSTVQRKERWSGLR
jgi:hypothetical protein